MNAPPWPWVAVFTVGLMLVVLILAGTRRVVRRMRCPLSGRDVVLHVQEAAWDGRAVDIESCSAFSPAAAVRCDKRCLEPSPAEAGDVPVRRPVPH
jgi:hypothetical protein